MEQQFISAKAVCARIGISRTTLWRLGSSEQFVKPVRIGRRIVYKATAVDQWMAERAEG